MQVINDKISKKIIEEFTVNGICKYSKKKLGELLHKRHPDLFKTAESGRDSIRRVTLAHGKRARKEVQNRVEWKGFQLPEPEKDDFSKVIVNQKRIGVLSDIHFPYYDRVALNEAIKTIINYNPDCIILNGDIIDCYHLSSFEKDPKKRSFKYELDMLKNFFVQLRELFPTQRIIYKIGNHEERYERYILQRIPEFLDMDLIKFENVVQAKEFGIEIVTNKRVMKVGSLNILHGHEMRSGIISPVNIARGFYMRTKSSTLGGHHHRTSEHIEQNLNGEIIGCFSTGCLCDLTPAYMPINSWNHGFSLVENFGNEFHVRNLKIINGKVV
jgi:predicted phosphodiesterase